MMVCAEATAKEPEWAQQAWVVARLSPLAMVSGAGRRLRAHCRSGWPHWSPMEDERVVLGQWPVGVAAPWMRASQPVWGRRTIRWVLVDELTPGVLVAQCQASPVGQTNPVR